MVKLFRSVGFKHVSFICLYAHCLVLKLHPFVSQFNVYRTSTGYKEIVALLCVRITLENIVLIISRYIDDIPHIEGELCGAVVLSTHSHAKITVDASEAEKMDGVHAFISVSDVTGSNITGN